MNAFIIFSCLFATNAIFAISQQHKEIHFITDEPDSFSQHYLAMCHKQNIENLPMYLRNAAQEKQAFFTDITILDLKLPPATHIHEILESIFNSNADVVHLSNISTKQAMHLFEILEQTYAHFIHVPHEKMRSFVASKYPLSQAAVTRITQENDIQQEVLEFAIHGANIHHARICSDDLSMQIINSSPIDDDKTRTYILLAGLPCILTIINQQYSPLRLLEIPEFLATETFQFLPIRNIDGKTDDDRGGYKAEIRAERTWGGKDGGSWEGSATFEAYDHHGNYIEAEVKQNDKGEGSLNARAGHEEN